ncbi:unnamed protein product [Mytilus edulis]|uniref:C2H2-type domain-containing protein n=1 Tax=Mytilus edulis TaxID=6550 RepID=A0A8S3QM61_MYTED|nr:unnamed protein product [Mytilus edulis]
MQRHINNNHGKNQPYLEQKEHSNTEMLSPSTLTLVDNVILCHPFTMMLAGPTGSGKTFWMKTLLERARRMIKPSPERIIWCYKRWQPLFSEMQQTVKNIIFVQGIPDDLNNDSFIDPKYPSLVVIDDLMKDATNSKDVCELFIEGSHHRNLSVACLMQNAFSKGKENRTMSINSQYIVLFKNPRDQVTPAVFARQMYPNNSKRFMNKYIEGVKRPYGYLFIDLKQNTLEEERLKIDIFNEQNQKVDSSDVMIGGGMAQYKNDEGKNIDQFEVRRTREQSLLGDYSELFETKEEKMPSCDECGLMFENVSDLMRHVKTWCPENNDLKRKFNEEYEDIPSKKFKKEIQIEDGEDDVFKKLAKYARDETEDIWEEKVDKYLKNGMSETEAKHRANRKLRDDELDKFMWKYANLVHYILQLRVGRLHLKVVKFIEKLVQEGTEYKKAIKMAIRKYKNELDNYLDEVIEEEENGEEEEGDDDDEEEEGDEEGGDDDDQEEEEGDEDVDDEEEEEEED